MTSRFIVGDVFDGLRTLEDDSVDLIVSSPPFLALRSYLPNDHELKGKEIGSEATPAAFLDVLLDVVEECARVLAPHGSLVFELGDTYSGSGGAGGDYDSGGLRDGQQAFDGSARRGRGGSDDFVERRDDDRTAMGPRFRSMGNREHRPPGHPKRGGVTEGNTVEQLVPMNGGPGWPDAKSLCMIPQSFAWALSYGRNPFNGRETPRWKVRNIVRWCRPNPPVGALGDKFRPGTSEMVVATKSGRRWFDLDAVRHEHSYINYSAKRDLLNRGSGGYHTEAKDGVREWCAPNPAGAPPLDWWEIPTQPYAGSHYATWPEKLLTRPILSMCPERVCNVCGVPSRRIVDHERELHAVQTEADVQRQIAAHGKSLNNFAAANGGAGYTVTRETVGWSDCGHDDWRRGIVLDCFGGSGTTAAVAEGHGRDSILIDLDARNADLAAGRCGMFLSVEEADSAVEEAG
jgi:SAM-dependent methyltransferase